MSHFGVGVKPSGVTCCVCLQSALKTKAAFFQKRC